MVRYKLWYDTQKLLHRVRDIILVAAMGYWQVHRYLIKYGRFTTAYKYIRGRGKTKHREVETNSKSQTFDTTTLYPKRAT